MRKIYECERVYKDKRRKGFREIINGLKDKPCADCNVKYDPCVMDFDHLDPSSKKESVSKLIRNGSFESIMSEIKKCEVVCANCHRMRTKKQQEKGIFFIGFKKSDESQLTFL